MSMVPSPSQRSAPDNLPLAVLEREVEPALLRRARGLVAALPAVDRVPAELYAVVVALHLRPLPADRAWRTRHARVRRRLPRAAQHDLPAGPDPVVVAADHRIEAARAAWLHLRRLGLVGGRADDLVTRTLEVDLAADPDDVA